MTATSAFFFYGTLMNTRILNRVLKSKESRPSKQAILKGYTRHKVYGCDYPAVIPGTEKESSVLGVVVEGLDAREVEYLDIFEGSEYERQVVTVELTDTEESLVAQIYIWISPRSHLENAEWNYDDFVREKLTQWVGPGGEEEYREVDVHRARWMRQALSYAENSKKELEPFGKEFGEKYFLMEDGWTNLNHGSYGCCPKPTMEVFRKFQEQAESFPDRFMRRQYVPLLDKARARVSKLVNCDTEDLVFVPNATTGVNIALRSVEYKLNDAILYIDTTVYGSCENSILYILDSKPSLKLRTVPVPVTYPISDKDLLKKIEDAIVGYESTNPESKVRVMLLDAISSNPGVVVPWERIVALLRNHDVFSIVDGAHAIGQISLDMKRADPDWFVSNLHKWAFAHRGVAMFYCKREHQWNTHSMPISHGYNSPEHPSHLPLGDKSRWVSEYEWIGTQDWSSILSVEAALEFRERVCGGEERIMTWCNQLANEGGKAMVKILGGGSVVMENGECTLIASMVNVSLPLAVSPDAGVRAKQSAFIVEQMFRHKFHIPMFVHGDKWWLRVSAQVYNELYMFISVAHLLKAWCRVASDFQAGQGLVEEMSPRPLLSDSTLVQKEMLESFGKEFGRKYFLLEDGVMNLNHGSYGSCPRPTLEAFRKMQDQAESFPDRFIKREYISLINEVRKRVSKLVNCETEDLVFVANATTGVNIALRSVEYQPNDAILYIETTVYDACRTSIEYILDSKPDLKLRTLPVRVTYPISDQGLLDKIESAIVEYETTNPESKVRVALIDAISSNPGVVLPWERIVALLKRYNVLSLIDGAHAIGQIPLDMKNANPDWFVSNMHKWAYAHRGVAMFYCKRSHQWNTHSMPISQGYSSPEHPTRIPPLDKSQWISEYLWMGTQDWSPLLSIPAALEFREKICGGEERIMKWCNKLAKEGGEAMARILGEGSVVMQNEEKTLVASMVNVSLPLVVSDDPKLRAKQFDFLKEQMFNHNFYIPAFVHGDRWWLRISAQVYNELTEFISAAQLIRTWCKIASDLKPDE
ncbi:PLP-dependent transferase, partial [Atractiella rhizophila]